MAGEELILAAVLAAITVLVILRAAIKVVREYERLVIFRLGRLFPTPKGPGLTVIIPIFDRRVLIDLRTVAFDVPRQRVVSRDNVSVEVDAVVYYRVYDPLKAVTRSRTTFRRRTSSPRRPCGTSSDRSSSMSSCRSARS